MSGRLFFVMPTVLLHNCCNQTIALIDAINVKLQISFRNLFACSR
jgi:hypothetical protein